MTEKVLQTIHALVMGDGKQRVKPTPYRDGQNVIPDGRTKALVYMPPEAKDVPKLMQAMRSMDPRKPSLTLPLGCGNCPLSTRYGSGAVLLAF